MTEQHTHEHEEEYITIVDEEGNEELYQILFTFDSEGFGKSYVFCIQQERAKMTK